MKLAWRRPLNGAWRARLVRQFDTPVVGSMAVAGSIMQGINLD